MLVVGWQPCKVLGAHAGYVPAEAPGALSYYTPRISDAQSAAALGLERSSLRNPVRRSPSDHARSLSIPFFNVSRKWAATWGSCCWLSNGVLVWINEPGAWYAHEYVEFMLTITQGCGLCLR